MQKPLDKVTKQDIITHFPLEGTFYFRFKFLYGTERVWLDLEQLHCKVPKYENKIIVKATRKEPKDVN